MLQKEFDIDAKNLFDQLRKRINTLKASPYMQKLYEDVMDAKSDFDKGQKGCFIY
jgi:hypothetical protein